METERKVNQIIASMEEQQAEEITNDLLARAEVVPQSLDDMVQALKATPVSGVNLFTESDTEAFAKVDLAAPVEEKVQRIDPEAGPSEEEGWSDVP